MRFETYEELSKHNESVLEQIKEVKEEINGLEEHLSALVMEIHSPCRWCDLDGEYRCEDCRDSLYEGFNKPDWYGC